MNLRRETLAILIVSPWALRLISFPEIAVAWRDVAQAQKAYAVSGAQYRLRNPHAARDADSFCARDGRFRSVSLDQG
jgi:hypothetical protein